jgi:hypothetical protein
MAHIHYYITSILSNDPFDDAFDGLFDVFDEASIGRLFWDYITYLMLSTLPNAMESLSIGQ